MINIIKYLHPIYYSCCFQIAVGFQLPWPPSISDVPRRSPRWATSSPTSRAAWAAAAAAGARSRCANGGSPWGCRWSWDQARGWRLVAWEGVMIYVHHLDVNLYIYIYIYIYIGLNHWYSSLKLIFYIHLQQSSIYWAFILIICIWCYNVSNQPYGLMVGIHVGVPPMERASHWAWFPWWDLSLVSEKRCLCEPQFTERDNLGTSGLPLGKPT